MKTIPRALLEPLLISESGLQLVLAVWSRGQLFEDVRQEALAARKGKPLENARRTSVRDGVAVIPITGPLMRHASMFSEISGATSYAQLAQDLQVALDDKGVRAILLEVDSPGGDANGVGELAQAIRAASETKPVWAYVGGSGCSAAYWLASAADHVVAAETAFVGSIGCRLVAVDDTGADAMAGIKQIEIISSQSPAKRGMPPYDDSAIARLQQRADDLAGVFVEAVAKNRGVDVKTVLERFGAGDVLMGAKAEAAGMVDAIGTFEGTLAELARESDPYTVHITGATTMADEPKNTISADELGDLRSFRAQVLARTGAASAEEALGKVAAGAEALRDLPGVRAELATVKADLIRRDLRATLDKGLDDKRLTLGSIQTTIPLLVRAPGAAEKMQAAFAALPQIERVALVDAACAVDIAAADLAAIRAYAKSAAPTAAEPHVEPERKIAEETKQLSDLDKTVTTAASEARRVMDRHKKPAAK